MVESSVGNYEGHKATVELPTNVYRIDVSGEAYVATDAIRWPNGLCFSLDESLLYVVESGASPANIHVFDVVDDGKRLTNQRLFASAGAGIPDGIRCDVEGNLWCGWGGGESQDGVVVFAPDGTLIGHIHLPERCANICFGGLHRNRLFMAASQSVYSLYVNTQGANQFTA